MKNSTKKAVFILPRPMISRLAGGYKMVYLYANLMQKEGWRVGIQYSMYKDPIHFSTIIRLKSFILFCFYKITRLYEKCNWFELNKNIKKQIVWKPISDTSSSTELFIATAIGTAYSLEKMKLPTDRKIYFIQGFENWDFSDEEVYKSYQFGFKMVTISNWLNTCVASAGEKSTVIPNGFDKKIFFIEKKIQERASRNILMMYHKDKHKGIKYGMQVILRLQKKYPNLNVTLFGVPQKPYDLPSWINYEQRPTRPRLRHLYNEASIYIAPSLTEGWGLTVGEAMMCGCAIACTDIGGFREMAQNGETALMSAPTDVDAMYANVCCFIDNDALRCKMATKGNEYIQKFSLDKSYKKWMVFIDDAYNSAD